MGIWSLDRTTQQQENYGHVMSMTCVTESFKQTDPMYTLQLLPILMWLDVGVQLRHSYTKQNVVNDLVVHL